MPNARRKKYAAQQEEKKRKKSVIPRGKDDPIRNVGFGPVASMVIPSITSPGINGDVPSYLLPQLSVSNASKSFDFSMINEHQYEIDAHVSSIQSEDTMKKNYRLSRIPQISSKLPRSKHSSPSSQRCNKDITVTSSDIDLLLANSDRFIGKNNLYKLVELTDQESNSCSTNYNRSLQNSCQDSTIQTSTLQNLHKAISMNGTKPIVQKVSKAILTSKSLVNLSEKTCVAEFTQTYSLEVQLSLDEETACPSDEVPAKHDDAVGNSSVQSMEDMCRICHGGEMLSNELGALISACSCRGSVGRVHVKCLERWLTESGKNKCELCGVCYATHRIHRYGVSRSLIMWLLSQNAKQLLVDSLGIMLMSPIAVLAAWLSGRTLTGLMAHESQLLSWPLASTFVLACMTLVCYYCWIVSAATRHALDWWLWYRSQYEVKLQLRDNHNR